MKRRYGLLGFFSVIGLLGFWTHNPVFFPFLGFALFFEYFFVETDEMFADHMRKAAAWAFFADLTAVAAVTCYEVVVLRSVDAALTNGIAFGFGIAIMFFCFATAYFDWKDRRGVSND